MADEEERVFTVPLGDVWSVPRTQRTPRAVRYIRDFVRRHMKAKDENVWIDPRLNEILWKRGREKPPRRLQVKVIKFEDELVEVSPLEPEAELETEEEPKKEIPAEGKEPEPKEAPAPEESEEEAPKPPEAPVKPAKGKPKAPSKGPGKGAKTKAKKSTKAKKGGGKKSKTK